MPDFRFRLPSIDELTPTQRIAYVIKKPLLVTGGPGSGKTVVSIFRYLKQIADARNELPLFFTFNRTLMSSIRGTLRQRSDILLPELSNMEVEELIMDTIGSVSEWYYENFNSVLKNETIEELTEKIGKHIENREDKYFGLFIDEAQDIGPEFISCASLLSDMITCGADRAQDLQGNYVQPADEVILQMFKEPLGMMRQSLTRNFRNTKETFEFARQFVPEDISVKEINTDELPNGDNPEIFEMSTSDQLKLIKQIIEDNPNSNIGILLHTGPQIDDVKTFLEQNGYTCDGKIDDPKSFSYYKHNMPLIDRKIMESRLQTPFILTFDSCKGLEFDIVIMPMFEKSDWALNNPKRTGGAIDYQANGMPKMYATPNHYYVAVTRARRQLYLMYETKPNILSFYNKVLNESTDDLPF